ncbi:ATP-dependent RNA helicase BRR2 [Pneumocystis jirovecii RU7]|uniref:RNA helicase n=1 Tax=Pneumocystis jirovecii (strain RU7) TaxID=1408657 RepID=A0A0W4ZD48_PNEJ7|nr:ATP-dependent RNA helicase BRR2 [Pneumocystis jirovecii RU7]KTW26222.1 hypothetical protein T551_03522 [Pneumocystis jirovecii RU7]
MSSRYHSQAPNMDQYKYSEISNKVSKADQRFVTRRDHEATGEPESLAGRISVKDMGSRASKNTQPEDIKKKDTVVVDDEFDQKYKKKVLLRKKNMYSSILDTTEDLEGLIYHPKTKETRETYEALLAYVYEFIGDQSHDIVRSASDTVLEFLKDENLKDYDRKKEIDKLLGVNISSERFSQLIAIGKKITDYSSEDFKDIADDDYQELDEQRVAVIFDDDENENMDNEMDDDDQEESDIDSDAENKESYITIVNGKTNKYSINEENKEKVFAHQIDSFWLQRIISAHYNDPYIIHEKTSSAISFLESNISFGQLENELMELFDYDKFELVKILTRNRDTIVWCMRLLQATDPEAKKKIEIEMKSKGYEWILRELKEDREALSLKHSEKYDHNMVDHSLPENIEKQSFKDISISQISETIPKKVLDLDSLKFSQGAHLMSNKKCKLPEGSFKRSKKGYEEVHVPPPKKAATKDIKTVLISDMPEWVHPVFGNTEKLNPIQSKLYPMAFGKDDNLLICAPTGAGKTNVAMLCILNELKKHRNESTGEFNKNNFKIVYIAPLKALVQEMAGNFSSRLSHYGIQVEELTGDAQLTKAQISQVQVIVTTPEKWDVITRKATEVSYTNLVRLIIIDEIHLLHDDRGPVLEAIVARTIRKTEQTFESIRLIGLSATLPNYMDVATFLKVDLEHGLFYFDNSYRPCPLKQEFIGITEKKAIKRLQLMNDITYEKVMEQARKFQVLIFVHSRKETAKTAKFIRDKCLEEETIGQILHPDAATREILQSEAKEVSDTNLKDILPYGLGIHHAGMTRADRKSAEELFAAGHIKVLVSTSTLAWGVNLPAHAVIIKGTQVYSPEKGRWVELSPQDVLQMLGRAGRPQYDSYGEGIIITSHPELQYYLSLLNQQLPIESQFISKIVDNLNAEIVLGTVRNRDEAAQWLGYTYLYIRMLRSPVIYNVGADYADDLDLEQKRIDLIHSAALLLDKHNLIKYDKKTGDFQTTEIGRIASHYYITYESMATYNQYLRPTLSYIELFRLFCLSDEFKYIPVREEEKLELQKLLSRVPIPIKEGVEEASAKINTLLQAYISRLKLEGFALISDMIYVTQSAKRILRAIFDICLKRGWAQVAKLALDMCKMVEKCMWPTMTPLRQFKVCPLEVIRKVERKDLPWSRYFDLDPHELGELISVPKAGKLVHKLIQHFPRLELQVHVQPIVRSLLRVNLTIIPQFEWDHEIHSFSELFWIIAEDVNGEQILFHDQFILKEKYSKDEHYVEFTVPISEPIPPNYFITIISDRWMHSETKLSVAFKHLILPEKIPPYTPLLDLQPLPIAAVRKPEFIKLYSSYFQHFNKIQTQVFNTLFTTDENVFVGAPTGSGKTTCAEFALIRHWLKENSGRAVYIAPFQELVDERYNDWSIKFKIMDNHKEIIKLTGETSEDLKLLQKADLVLATPVQWDVLSRRWKQRKNIQTIELFIADEIHAVGGHLGPVYEVIVSRMRYIAAQTENKIRIIALGLSLANARELGEWIGINQHCIYNFNPKDRPRPLEVTMQSFTIPHFASLMIAMTKPLYLILLTLSHDFSAIIFVPSRKQCLNISLDILTYCNSSGNENRFLLSTSDDIMTHIGKVKDEVLANCLSHGIGYYHEALSKSDKDIVISLYRFKAIQILFVSRDVAYSVGVTAHMVVVMGTQYFEGREHRYIDYPISEILQMLGYAYQPNQDGISKAVIMVPAVKKEYYKKFLSEALPIESHLQIFTHDAFVTEIATSTIENKQEAVDWLTWSYMYRRLVANPGFYGLQDISHESLSSYLSDLVETTLNDLMEKKIILIEDDFYVTPLNLAMIASYYNLTYVTVETMALSLTSKTKMKGLLEVVTAAAEFETIPIRRHEDVVLRRIYERVPVKLQNQDFDSPSFKAFILLQAHFSRFQLPIDLVADQVLVLQKIMNLLSACVDVMSSEGYLNSSYPMELSQMCVQAVWDRDSPLKQVPHFTEDVIKRCMDAGLESIYDLGEFLADASDDSRNKLLEMGAKEMRDVANFINSYPSIDIVFELDNPESITAGCQTAINITLTREMEEINTLVYAPFFPTSKNEHWWIVIGDGISLLAIKKVTLQKTLSVKLEFVPPNAGKYEYTLSCFSDSYVGVDQDIKVDIVVAERKKDNEMEE